MKIAIYKLIYPLKMEIFHSYVSLPEGYTWCILVIESPLDPQESEEKTLKHRRTILFLEFDHFTSLKPPGIMGLFL